MHQKHRSGMLIGAGLLAVAGVAWAQATVKLSINGSVVTTTTRSIGGKTWVPLDDVARALKMQKSSSAGTITLRPAGGTYQVANKLQGDQGQELFSGKYGFAVQSFARTKRWERQFKNGQGADEPIQAGAGEELVVVSCRLKNGLKEKVDFSFATSEWGENTALTNQDAGSYEPKAYDVPAEMFGPLGKSALPGSSLSFNIIFAVPEKTKLKDVVYSAVLYSERGLHKGTHFRVALKEPAE